MALTLVCQLGAAAALLVLGVCLGVQAQPRVESRMHRAIRLIAIALAVVLFLMYVGESMGFGPSLGAVFQRVALRAQRLWETGTSLVWSVF